MRTYRLALVPFSFLLLSTACRDAITTPGTQPPSGPKPLGLVEVTLSGIGSTRMSASVSVPSRSSFASGPRYTLSVPGNGGGGGDGSIQMEPLSTGSFTEGARGAGGYRYVWATFRVRNAQADSTAYDTPRRNLTFFAVSTSGTLRQSAISSMRRFDGSVADASIALAMLPTGAVVQNPATGARSPASADVLQVISESEAAAVNAPAGVNSVLPYGFVARNANDGGRTLAASPAAGQYDGVVTFSFKIPLQATAAADPFTVSAMFLAEDDSETRVTQSLEEQGGGQAAFETRASEIGAAQVTLFGGGAYTGAATPRTICSVRTAGMPGAATATLSSGVSCTPSGSSLKWTGAVSTEWTDPGNWNVNSVPMATDTVVIDSTANQPLITDADKTLGGLVMAGRPATLGLGGFTLTITGDANAPSGTVGNGTVLLSGSSRTVRGTFAALLVTGSTRASGNITTHGAVQVSNGALTVRDNALTVSLP